jgi:hypothetical protein
VSTWFQGLFHPPLGVLFTFPSRYLFTIGRLKFLALESGLPSFPQDCTCLVVLRIQAQLSGFPLYGTLTRSGRAFQRVRVLRSSLLPVLQPQPILRLPGLGFSRFARHYYGNLG